MLVQVGIAALESSTTITIPVEVVGMPARLEAQVSPDTVDVILSGPLPILDTLQDGDVRLFVDVTDLAEGIYTLAPSADILPEKVKVESILPASVGLSASEKKTRPNIIFILSDDISQEVLGCYGGTTYKTPNLDKLAATGTRFTHCYSQPVCAPSRVKLMTGFPAPA